MRSFSPARLTAPALDALAEGSLVWLVYLSFAGAESVAALGLLEFVLAAACGVTLARKGSATPVLWVGALTAGAAAWLADPVARETLLRNGLPAALPGGARDWLAGVAVVRGGAHRRPEHDDNILVNVLAAGVAVLVLPWVLHLGRSSGAFAASVILGSVVFLASALLALAHGRLSTLGLDPAGSDGGRAWMIVAAPVTLLLIVIALVAAVVLGAPLAAIVGALGGPLATALGAALVAAAALLGSAIDAGGRLLPTLPGPHGAPPQPGTVGAPGPAGAAGAGLPHELIVVVVLLAIATAVVLLVRYRRFLSVERPPKFVPRTEDRDRFLPHLSLRTRMPAFRPTFPRPPKKPRTAAEAYLAVLRELDHRPDVARLRAESPMQHARRVRDAGLPDTPLALLAADFQLFEYGNRILSPHEERRALSRGRTVTRAVRSRRVSSASSDRGRR